jgi:SAM-dependent methyltransferase
METDIYSAAKKNIFEAALARVEPLLPGRLLDIGCAGGELLKAAAGRGWLAEGIEIDPALAAAAVKGGFKVQMKPVESCGLEGDAYGAVTAFEVLSQMDEPFTAVREIYRTLKPGGVFYAREFNAAFHVPLYRLELAGFFRAVDARPAVIHNFNFTPGSLCVLLARAGFGDIRIRNSRPTTGDPYRTGGLLGGFFTGAAKVLYYWLAQALWLLSFGRVYAGSSLIVTARK